MTDRSVQYPKGEYACTVTVHFLVHHNAERCHALLEAAGAWKIQLNEEILFYDDGYWQSSHALWAEVQKADWSEVVMKEEFKEQVMEDVQGFFRSEDLYKSLSVPWKVSCYRVDVRMVHTDRTQRGIIIHGPPGNGKTLTVKAVMKACIEQGFAPLYVKSFRHETSDETAMVDVFDKARKMAPCIMASSVAAYAVQLRCNNDQ